MLTSQQILNEYLVSGQIDSTFWLLFDPRNLKVVKLQMPQFHENFSKLHQRYPSNEKNTHFNLIIDQYVLFLEVIFWVVVQFCRLNNLKAFSK